MEDYEIDYEQTCPHCGHTGSHYRDCDSLNCDEGFADENFDDPINSPEEGVDLYICPECKGRGIIEWCPQCGYNYKPSDFKDDSDEQN